MLLPGTELTGEISCFAFARRRGRAGVGGWGAWGRRGWGCCPAQGFSCPASLQAEHPAQRSTRGDLPPLQGRKQPAAPEHAGGSPVGRPGQARGLGKERGPYRSELSPEQMMKAGAFPRRALVLLKQSRSGRLSQGSTTSHRTGKWLSRSGLVWLWPSMAVPQRRAWQMRVASSGWMPGLPATAPHSPCLCSSTKPEQPKSPSTSRSLAGPGKGRGKKHLVTDRDDISFRY